MKNLFLALIIALMYWSCTGQNQAGDNTAENALAQEVIDETLRSWQSYKQYAWGHDVLAPLSKTFKDWYREPLYISPIDAYSTLFVMGLQDETRQIEAYVVDSLNFDKDQDVKVFEVNIRILGGLLSMYGLSKNPDVLEKAIDFADRIMPAFDTPTGIPKYWVNLKTGDTRGDTVNVAEAATYTFEMGILSYYSKDPKYYQAGKKATKAIFERRSKIGLIGDVIDVESGEWVSEQSHFCAGVDSYYEYLYKSYLLFGDSELGDMWNASITLIHQFLAEQHDGKLWYGRANMHSGQLESSVVTLYDAFFPALLSLSGDTARAIELQRTWQWLWDRHGLEPMVYDYKKDSLNYPVYDLNPEIMESAYYLFNITGDSTYYRMNEHFWSDIKEHCRTDLAFTSIENVQTMEKRDYMPTFFFAETLKYLYLTFSNGGHGYRFGDYLFNTEAHPFKKADFDRENVRTRLGIQGEKK